MQSSSKPVVVAVAIVLSVIFRVAAAQATASAQTADRIIVTGTRIEVMPAPAGLLTESDFESLRAGTSDTASLLRDVPGLSLRGAGGVSSLPAIHGLADDRVRTRVDGVDHVSACSNHMNPPLSYLDPTGVAAARVFAGSTPVSVGGDSIGGTIVVESAAPVFADAGAGVLFKGETGGYYRSNGDAYGGNVAATLASDTVSLRYTGAVAQADNYEAAHDFKPAGPAAADRGRLDGDEVGSTYYETTNQALGLAWRHLNHLVDFKYSRQHIPDQGFPNQRMDMTANESDLFNLRYRGVWDWGAIESRLYYESTRHSMNFGEDKQFFYGDAPGMPMETNARNVGLTIRADIALNARDILRTGIELQDYRLDDYWPPSGSDMMGMGMMSPDTFLNINGGERDRYDVYGEWEAGWSPRWSTLLGLRYGAVRMDTGDVQGYSNHDGMGMHNYRTESAAFNARDHERDDDNIDVTVLARYTPDAGQTYEAGYARKNRSPNLYERYAWSTSGMSMIMVNTAGDGNGYVGDLDLEPETAHTLSATVDWHAAGGDGWALRLTPYYTYVEDYIDARRCSSVNMMSCGMANLSARNRFVFLQYANEDARLYGVDVSGTAPLANSAALGSFRVDGLLGYVGGRNEDTGDDLYNIMPLNAKLTLQHALGNWANAVEGHFVSAKDDVSEVRNEIGTPGYVLFNLRSSYEWKQVRLDIGVENLLDKHFYLPLGGAYTGQGATMAANGIPYGIAVPGMGRSIYTGVNFRF